MRNVRLIFAAVSLASSAACSTSTSPTATVQPNQPTFDGSGMVGSGK